MKRTYITSLIILVIVLVSCAATIHDTSKVQYVREDFNNESIRAGALALLPVHAGEGQEGYRRPLADAINSVVDSLIPSHYGLKFYKWQETIDMLNEHDLVKSYQDAISTYRETAIINKDLLHDIGSKLGVRYLLFVSLERFHKASKVEYSIFTGWGTTKTAEVTAFAQIWDCGDGDVLWEGFGSASSRGTELTYERGYEVYTHIAAEGLIRKLFNLPPAQPRY